MPKWLLACLMSFVLFPPAWAQTMAVNIGVNVGGVADYAVESFFVDAMKQSRHWGSPQTPWDEAAKVDALGWPMQDAGVVVLCCVADSTGKSVLPGTYALSFTGSATVGLVATSGSISAMQYDAATNVSTAQIMVNDIGAGTQLMLSFTGTRRTPQSALGSGVTHVSVIRPHYAPNGRAWWNRPTQIFTNPFLALLQPFSTLRFMDFTATNGNQVTSWSQRTIPQDATQQSPNGAAWEYAIALANTLHKDMWINIPDEANADYVTQLAQLLHTTLDPTLHIWLEYSNEVWNYSFAQAGRNQAAAEAMVAADPGSPLAVGCRNYQNCRYVWGARRVGLEAVLNGQIFASVFGADAAMVRPVYATQVGQTYYVSLVFSMIAATMGPPAHYLYALAQAPYWAGDNSLQNQTVSQLLNQAASSMAQQSAPEHDFAAWATDYGLQSVTYEGGPGMSGTASLAAKITANRSARMGSLVTESLRQAFGNGISLYMYYNDAGAYGQYGMWGATESVFDAHTPKLAAMRAVQADGAEKLATGYAVPGGFTAGMPDFCNAKTWIVQGATYANLNQGGSCAYLINVPAAGRYPISLNIGNYGAATTGRLLIDQRPAGSLLIPGGVGLDWTPSSSLAVKLSAGLHVLTVQALAGSFAMTSIEVGAP